MSDDIKYILETARLLAGGVWLHHEEVDEISAAARRIEEENQKLREAVIFERARYIWGHRKCEDGAVAIAVAERELRAEGVIE